MGARQRPATPALAGTANMRHPGFLAVNATDGLAWGGVVVLVSYLARESDVRVEKLLGRGSALVVAAIVIIALAV